MSLFGRYRKTLERHYTERADVLAERLVENPLTGLSRPKWTVAAKDIPCRVSRLSLGSSGTNPLPEAGERIKLFAPPDVRIPPGSRIRILKDGRETVYRHAGQATLYGSDQEIILERMEGVEL